MAVIVLVETKSAPSKAKIWLAMGAIYLIWGSTYLGIRYGVETIPPLLMMAARHLSAGVVVYAWARHRQIAAPSLRQWGLAAVAGAFLFLVGHGVLAWAELKVPSGLAAVISATLPLWTTVLARIHGSEARLGPKTLLGLVFGFVGVAWLAGPEAMRQHLELWSGAAVLGSVLAWAVGSLYSRGSKLPESTVLSASMQMIMGGAELLIAAILTGEWRGFHLQAVSTKSVLALAYLSIFGSILAFTAFTWLLSVVSPSRLSTYAYVNPLVAVFLGWALAGEKLGVNTLAATAVILVGVALVSTRNKPKAEQKRSGLERPTQRAWR